MREDNKTTSIQDRRPEAEGKWERDLVTWRKQRN